MQGSDVRGMFEAVFQRDELIELVKRLGVQKRQRHFDPLDMVLRLVLLGGTAEAGRLAAAVRDYFEAGHTKVQRSAYYRWFDAEFCELMEHISARARTYVGAMPKHLPGILAGRRDWLAQDSTVVKLLDCLYADFPGTGTYAALKVHTLVSLGCENVVEYEITPAREHDSPKLVLDERLSGTGLIVDLGYVSHALLRRAAELDIQLVVRLKKGWAAYLDVSGPGLVVADWKFPASIEEYFDGETRLPTELGVPLDVDVVLGRPGSTVRARLVTVEVDDGHMAFLTTVPRKTHDAAAVGMLYRLRWGVELQHKLAKSGCQLDHITAKSPVSARILVHSAMIASMLANATAHLEHVSQGMVGEKSKRPIRPPHHAMLNWKCIVAAAPRISDLLQNPDGGQKLGWDHVASVLTHGGADPNWRRKPSPIDDAKGRNATGIAYWKLRPPKPRPARAAAK